MEGNFGPAIVDDYQAWSLYAV